MKKIMEKSKYIRPEISICNVETDKMMATSPIGKYEDTPASDEFDILSNENKFTDIWGNEY